MLGVDEESRVNRGVRTVLRTVRSGAAKDRRRSCCGCVKSRLRCTRMGGSMHEWRYGRRYTCRTLCTVRSAGRRAHDDERLEDSMGVISGESDAGQLNDTIAMDRDSRKECRTTCCVVVETTSTSVECQAWRGVAGYSYKGHVNRGNNIRRRGAPTSRRTTCRVRRNAQE